MGIFSFISVFGNAEDDMAKRKTSTKVATDNSRLVTDFVGRLSKAGTEKTRFEAVVAELRSDERLTAPDIIGIAHLYMGGGKKPASKAAAMSAISKRFIEIVRFHAKNRVAEKARPW